jgi:predicted nucleic acid-binding protein
MKPLEEGFPEIDDPVPAPENVFLTRYMLHTNIVSDLIRNPQGRAAKRIAKLGEDNICTSIIVSAELRYGCAKSGSKRLRSEPRVIVKIGVRQCYPTSD